MTSIQNVAASMLSRHEYDRVDDACKIIGGVTLSARYRELEDGFSTWISDGIANGKLSLSFLSRIDEYKNSLQNTDNGNDLGESKDIELEILSRACDDIDSRINQIITRYNKACRIYEYAMNSRPNVGTYATVLHAIPNAILFLTTSELFTMIHLSLMTRVTYNDIFKHHTPDSEDQGSFMLPDLMISSTALTNPHEFVLRRYIKSMGVYIFMTEFARAITDYLPNEMKSYLHVWADNFYRNTLSIYHNFPRDKNGSMDFMSMFDEYVNTHIVKMLGANCAKSECTSFDLPGLNQYVRYVQNIAERNDLDVLSRINIVFVVDTTDDDETKGANPAMYVWCASVKDGPSSWRKIAIAEPDEDVPFDEICD